MTSSSVLHPSSPGSGESGEGTLVTTPPDSGVGVPLESPICGLRADGSAYSQFFAVTPGRAASGSSLSSASTPSSSSSLVDSRIIGDGCIACHSPGSGPEAGPADAGLSLGFLGLVAPRGDPWTVGRSE